MSLGARGWQIFRRVTLPNIKWGLLYGVILCNARAMGEFGAVYVVSGHIAGQTDTMPLRVEKLFQEYNIAGVVRRSPRCCRRWRWSRWRQDGLEWKTRTSSQPVRKRSTTRRRSRAAARRSHAQRPPSVPAQEQAAAWASRSRTSPSASATSPRSTTSSLEVPRRRAARAARARRAPARRRCCASSPASRRPTPARSSTRTRTPPHRSPRDRNVGFVFQHYALFRHMSVFENVAFGLRVRKWKEPQIRAARPRAAAPDAARRPRQPGCRRSSPAASASASPWPAPWRRSRRCCCSTSRSAPSTPRCARSCASGCAGCTTRSTSPASSSPTTRRRPSRSPTGSW